MKKYGTWAIRICLDRVSSNDRFLVHLDSRGICKMSSVCCAVTAKEPPPFYKNNCALSPGAISLLAARLFLKGRAILALLMHCFL